MHCDVAVRLAFRWHHPHDMPSRPPHTVQMQRQPPVRLQAAGKQDHGAQQLVRLERGTGAGASISSGTKISHA